MPRGERVTHGCVLLRRGRGEVGDPDLDFPQPLPESASRSVAETGWKLSGYTVTMSGSKKGPKLDPRMELVEAARAAVGANVERVLQYLPLAIHRGQEDTEAVHQLRVAVRRAGIALKVFAPCIPKKQRSALRTDLRRLRDAAGRARDWDAFLQTLSDWRKNAPSDHLPAADFLIGYARGSRAECQRDLVRLRDDLDRKTLERAWHAAEASLRLGKNVSGVALPAFAAEALARRLAPFEEDLATGLTAESLHPFRLHVKRLRYTLEVFRNLYEKAWAKNFLGHLEDLQSLLGRLHDHQVAEQHIEEAAEAMLRCEEAVRSRLDPGFVGIRRYLAEKSGRLMAEYEACRGRKIDRELPLRT